jgi:hypothetical protein
MGVLTSEVAYISATTGKGDHEVHKGHVVELERKNIFGVIVSNDMKYSRLKGIALLTFA